MDREHLVERVAALSLSIDGYDLVPLSAPAAGGWIRHTTVVRLHGGGQVGVGEDVDYDQDAQRVLQAAGRGLPLEGRSTLEAFWSRLDALEPLVPGPGVDPHHRRWAFESAALDLALRQAGRPLGDALGRIPRPVTFVASLGLGDPPTVDVLDELEARAPGVRFKIDFANTWTPATVDALAERAGRVAVVDLKGHYRGDFRGPDADADMYARIGAALPGAWLEDPALESGADAALAPYQDRITWDAILHAVADVEGLPFRPRCINIKPSRFGTVRELLRVYAHCEALGIGMYGGGQYELGPGRRQIQALASLFHPDAPNDVAPSSYNAVPLPDRLPCSPLPPPVDSDG